MKKYGTCGGQRRIGSTTDYKLPVFIKDEAAPLMKHHVKDVAVIGYKILGNALRTKFVAVGHHFFPGLWYFEAVILIDFRLIVKHASSKLPLKCVQLSLIRVNR